MVAACHTLELCTCMLMPSGSLLPAAMCAGVYRAAGREEDSRWLSGTYLLIHPAAKHLGNARVRLKVLLELNPQSSGRAHPRVWQVPQVSPLVVRAAGHGPMGPAQHKPAHKPQETITRDSSAATAQLPPHTADTSQSESPQQQTDAAVTAQQSLATSDGAEPVSVPAATMQVTTTSYSRLDRDTQPSSSKLTHAKPAQGYSPGSRPTDPPPVEQSPVTGEGLPHPHPQAVSSTTTTTTTSPSPAQGSMQSSPQQEQGSASGRAGDTEGGTAGGTAGVTAEGA